MDRKSG